MRILVDADSCKRIPMIEKIAKDNGIEVILFSDTSRVIHSNRSEVRYIGQARDAVDFAILNECRKGDIVITSDTGLASLVLAKRGYAMNCYGRYFTEYNIGSALNARYFRSKAGSHRGKVKGLTMEKQAHPDFSTSLNSTIQLSRKHFAAAM